MRIRRVKWKDHPVLGSLDLDFINTASGQPFRTVIFAGENGAGKTTVLEDLSSFLNLGSFAMFEYIEYTVNGSVYKAIPTPDDTTYPTYQQNFFVVIYVVEKWLNLLNIVDDSGRYQVLSNLNLRNHWYKR